MNELIKTEQQGRVLIATFVNPPHAYMNGAMSAELIDLIKRVDRDEGIGVCVFTGDHPERFLAHFDVAEIVGNRADSPPVSFRKASMVLRLARFLSCIPGVKAQLKKTSLAGILFLQELHGALTDMGRSGTIFIAAINGQTAGGGLELALACDLRYISEGGGVSLLELLLGFTPGAGGTQRLTRLIGRASALEIMLTGRVVPADEAKHLGLVNNVFGHDELMPQVLSIAQGLANRPSHATARVKQLILEGGSLSLQEGLHMDQSAFLELAGTPEAINLMQAYVEQGNNTGEVPAYNKALRRRFEDGEFLKR